MLNRLKIMLTNESGAVTIDWVVITAAVCGLAIAAFTSIHQGSSSVSGNVSTYLTDTTVEEIAGLE